MCNCSYCNSSTSSQSASLYAPNQNISWDNINYIPAWLTGENMVQTHEQTLTSAEILAIFTTGIEILPQPGTGKINDIVSCYVFLDAGATPYTNNIANRLVLKYTGATDEVMGIPGTFVASAADTRGKMVPKESIANWAENASVITTILNANPTLGNGTITLFVNFRIILNP